MTGLALFVMNKNRFNLDGAVLANFTRKKFRRLNLLNPPIHDTVFAMLLLCNGGLRKPVAKYGGPMHATVLLSPVSFSAW